MGISRTVSEINGDYCRKYRSRWGVPNGILYRRWD